MSAVPQSSAAPMPRCPLCAGEAEHKATMPMATALHQTRHLYACARCALGFIHPRSNLDQRGAIRPPDAGDTQRRPRILPRLRKHVAGRLDRGASLCNVIEEELPARSAILDIGGGSGALLQELAAQGHRVASVRRDAALPRSLEPGSCDGVVFSDVVAHLADPVKALGDAAALLKPGGLLFCEVPNHEALIARRSGMAWDAADIPPINFFTERSLVALVRSAGLVVRRVYFGGYRSGRAWRLLARTALAHPRVKYDSVGIVAAWPPAL